jgi:hypothetical protein
VLSTRALNRALLARQGLLEPWSCGPEEAIERLVGMQSQAPNAPYVGLWTRLQQFDPDELSTLMLSRRTVRIALMRSTLFLVSARDCLALRAVLQPVMDRSMKTNQLKRLPGLDVERLTMLARELMASEPRTFAQLGALLAQDLGDYAAADLAAVARTVLPLVQVTPRGVWGASRAAYHSTVEEWLGEQPSTEQDPTDAIRRYLTAFGPATVADIQAWCGLTGLAAYVAKMADELRVFADERGRELFDVPDGLLPDPETVVGVKILPEFDDALLSHADRSRIFSDDTRSRFMTTNGLVRSTYLVDGFVHGCLNISRDRSAGPGVATATIEPFTRVRRTEAAALRVQVRRLLTFLEPGARHAIVINQP